MQTTFAADVRSFVVRTFLLGEAVNLRDEDSFLDQGIIDSTGVLELISWIEESYGIEVGDGELLPENFDSISRVAAYLANKLENKPTAGGSAKFEIDSLTAETFAEAAD